MREFNVPLLQYPKKYSVIPIIPKTLHHSQKHSVIPAKAGIHNSRACGNSTSHYSNTRKNTPSFPKTLRHSQKHSVIPKNTPSFPKTLRFPRSGIHNSAHAGSHYSNTQKNTPSFPKTIPAKAGIHNMREFNVPLLQYPKKHSIIPKTLRHFQKHSIIPKTLHHSQKTLHHSQKHCVIPAKAGIHNSAHAGISNTQKNTPSFPKTLHHSQNTSSPPKTFHHSRAKHSRLRGNDVEVVLCGKWSVDGVFVEFPHARE